MPPGKSTLSSITDNRPPAVPQASPPASSSTVPVRESGTHPTPTTGTGGETSPELAAETAAVRKAGEARPALVPQASPPASSSTVSVRKSGEHPTPPTDTGGETPPELAAGTAAVRSADEARPAPVPQASSPASSSTVSVRESGTHPTSPTGTGGETPPELAAGTAAAPEPSEPPDPLVSGFHFRGVLPHLKKEGGTYFVTFRQAGSLPRDVLLRFKQERDAILQQALAAKRPLTWREQEELFRWYSTRVDKYLDAGHGVCYLRDPDHADLVAGAIRFFEGQRYEMRAWVVMPNHAHVVVWPMPGHTLSDILHSWKSYTAHEINKRLPARISPFWQSESYEHLIRDDEDLHRCCAYTLLNPANAGLCPQPEDWKWSSNHVPPTPPPASSWTNPVRESGAPPTPPD